MSKLKNENGVLDFEIVTADDDAAVYRQVLKKGGRTAKDIKKLEGRLPTATLHYFDKEDFENLKRIEAELIELYNKNLSRNKSSVLDSFFSFLKSKLAI